MADAEANIISRKINGLTVGRSPISRINLIGENFTEILDERLRRYLGCLTSSIILECEVKRLSQVLEDLPVPAMIAVVDVEGCDGKAMVNLGADLVFHIVDLKMDGDPDASPSPAGRGVTAIDIAICRGFIDILLGGLGQAIQTRLESSSTPALRVGGFAQQAAAARIAPEKADALILNVSLDIGDAARNGAFDVVLPLSVLDHFISGAAPRHRAPGRLQQNDRWSRHMARAAAQSAMRLTSVLHRYPISVEDLQSLEPGDVLPLPDGAPLDIAICLPGDGGLIARGRLGAFEGQKALKLVAAPDAAALQHVAALIAVSDT